MALWMEPGSDPTTERERADLDAISAIKDSSTLELKEKGNEYVKMGKKHYSDAIDCYTRAINQKALNDHENSLIYSNRAHVNLLLGNYRRALEDAEEAIKLSSTNVKYLPLRYPEEEQAFYRAAKASLSLNLLTEATSFCRNGLELSPSNEELKKLAVQVDSRKSEIENREAQVSKAMATAKNLASALEKRDLKLGKTMYQELTGVKKPVLDKSSILHWPVLLLYAEVMSSDFIEDFCETDMFSTHLDMMFSDSDPLLPWDKEGAYTRKSIELYYECGSGIMLSKREVLRYLLEGTAGSLVKSIGDDDETESDLYSNHSLTSGKGSDKWIKVNEKKTLHDILQQPNFVIPGIPVFYVVSNRSPFYKEFKAGKWAPP